MKKLLSFAATCLLGMQTLLAQYGVLGQPEWQTCQDPVTGLTLTLLTDTAKNDRFLYQTDPMWTPDGKYLLFRSSSRSEEIEYTDQDGNKKTRRPTQLYFIEVATGHIIQATTGEHTGSGFLANKSNRLFLNRRIDNKWNLYVIDLDPFFADVHAGKVSKPEKYETFIGTFPTEMGRPGSYCINSDDDWAYITVERDGTQEEIDRMNANAFLPESNQPVKIKPSLTGIRKMNLKTGEVSMVCNLEFKVGHIQASRFHGDEIVFCNETGGDAYQRMWYVKSDGSDLRPLYKETPLDWVTHETFATEDYVYFNVLGFQPRLRKQAHGIFRINLRNDDVDVVGQVETSAPATIDNKVLDGKGFWHCNASRDGRWATGDTFAGSVWIINTQTGERHQIASDCRMKPDHAQPFFSPDGTRLCFQSGRFSDGKRLTLVMVDLKQIKGAKDFVKGADVGGLSQQVDRGVKFHDREGNERECLDLLRDYQINAIRLRVWVNPKRGYCGKDDVLRQALHAKEMGMDLMIDFHYSDWWADPAKQPIPAAWSGHDYEQMKRDLHDHTVDVLSLLKANGVTPRWVQVGNETTNGMLWSVKTDPKTGWELKDQNGKTTITESMGHIKHQPEQYAGFIATGYDAVKEVFPEAIVIVHLDRGHRPSIYDKNLGILKKYGGKFDMIGMSLYPYWALQGHTERNADEIISDCMTNIRRLAREWDKDVMIVETGMEVDPEHPEVMEEGRRQLRRIIHEARTATDGRCRGVFYWEPQTLPGGYRLGAFDRNGTPTAIMDGFIEAQK